MRDSEDIAVGHSMIHEKGTLSRPKDVFPDLLHQAHHQSATEFRARFCSERTAARPREKGLHYQANDIVPANKFGRGEECAAHSNF